MRALLALVATLAMLGTALGTHGTPHPTTVSLTVPDLRVGEEATLVAVLRDDAGVPVTGVEILFELETTFGWLELGRENTRARGRATLLFVPAGPGAFTFRARFLGTAAFAPSEDEVRTEVADVPTRELFPTSTAIAFVVAIVVGSIWGAYAFIMLDLRRIWIEGGGAPFLKKRKEVRTR